MTPSRMVLLAPCFVASAIAALAGETQVKVTGRLLEVNGQAEFPKGLMGLHADTRLTEEMRQDWGVECFRQIHFGPGGGSVAWDKNGLREPFKNLSMVIDCQGDRYAPATVLTNPKYEEFFARIGRDYAQRCKDLNWHGYAEFWNEPYLNWAERSRKNYDPKFYDVTKATDEGPVTIKGWDKPLAHLRWRRLWARGEDGKIAHLVPLPKGAKPGDTFRHRLGYYFTKNEEQTYTVVEHWDVYDPTAVSFWSGKQNYDFYMWMFLPWAKAIKEANPDVTIIGGWCFNLPANGWKAWEILYKPMIDEGIAWLDGVCEHHYGSDTRVNAATYEVIVGYALTEHGKRLRCYNTETAGCVDPAVPGARHSNATPYGAFNYGLRDIVELTYRCPDKAAARAAHGSLKPGWGGGGDEFLFKLLKDFRGRLIHAACDDLSVWPVATLNGDKLVVVVFNDHKEDRTVRLAIDAPAGTTLEAGRKVWVAAKEEKGALQFHEAAVPASGSRFEGDLKVVQKTGVKLVFPLKGTPPAKTQWVRTQFFARGVLQKVEKGKPLALTVKVDGKLLARAEAAHLKVVLEGLRAAEGFVSVNGTRLPLPQHDWIAEVPLDPRLLKGGNALAFEAAGSGYQVDVASLVIEHQEK
ncbi:MAG: hypothetical protein FJ291_09465 [Planctomycetes bacterium]|nr:hypothetical protein [Planctomycetota bacterium]